jgi:hypothetical protein
MDFVPDINLARKTHDWLGYREYSDAYVVSNENLYQSIELMPQNCNRALTVAASGDHPFSCSLGGAKEVDTFDVSYNAGLVTKMKVLAIGCLDYLDYWDFLLDLTNKRDFIHIPNMDKIAPNLSPTEYNYLRSMRGCHIFSRGISPGRTEFDISRQDYEILQEIVKKPYDFMMTDVVNLSGKLTENYDFIHLSNVFDYLPAISQLDVLQFLVKHVNVGGRIFVSHLVGRPVCREFFVGGKEFSDSGAFKDWRIVETANNDISVFERTR